MFFFAILIGQCGRNNYLKFVAELYRPKYFVLLATVGHSF